jgi:uncharacterized protein YwqG
MDDLEELDELIDEHGLSEHRDVILPTAKPAVFIYPDERPAGRIGESRIGGIPDLPESLSWPDDPTGRRKLCFLMQISLYELPVFDGTPFPRRGMLYLFGDEGGGDAGRMMLHTGREPLLPTEPPAGKPFATDACNDLVPHRIGFQMAPDVPRWSTADFFALCGSWGQEDEDALHDLAGAISLRAVGKLLGHVSGIGHDPRDSMGTDEPASWVSLLELNSQQDLNLEFSDSGYLQALVHRNDLERLDFSRVYVNLQSS